MEKEEAEKEPLKSQKANQEGALPGDPDEMGWKRNAHTLLRASENVVMVRAERSFSTLGKLCPQNSLSKESCHFVVTFHELLSCSAAVKVVFG